MTLYLVRSSRANALKVLVPLATLKFAAYRKLYLVTSGDIGSFWLVEPQTQ